MQQPYLPRRPSSGYLLCDREINFGLKSFLFLESVTNGPKPFLTGRVPISKLDFNRMALMIGWSGVSHN